MTSNTNNFSLRSVLKKDKLNGANFLDWYRNLRIVLTQERVRVYTKSLAFGMNIYLEIRITLVKCLHL